MKKDEEGERRLERENAEIDLVIEENGKFSVSRTGMRPNFSYFFSSLFELQRRAIAYWNQ